MAADKVLIIEDSRSLASAIKAELLESYNVHSDIAQTIEQAQGLLKTHSATYFAANVDLELPDCESGAAVDLVNHYHIPAVIFTGLHDPAIRERFNSQNIVDYVYKSGPHSINHIAWLFNRVALNRKLTVLVVDDSQSALVILKKMLSNQGFNVSCAKGSNECMTAMKSHPDIVILDQFLTDGLGHELCRKIRTVYPDPILQIIGISSKADENTASFILKNGGDDFILRPFNPEEFALRINRRAEYVSHIRELRRISEEKNKFLGMAAHDLRNPLWVIQQANKHLFSDDIAGEQKRVLRDLIDQTTSSMQQLLDDLLDITSIESGEIELNRRTINLTKITKERICLFRDRAGIKNIEILEKLPDSAMVEVDPVKITQVIDNLLSNAIKYSPENLNITINIEKENAKIRFNVVDQGPGVKEKDLNKLFKVFHRLGHKTTGGESSHGLGLYICLKIVSAHGGEIAYKPAQQQGGHFFFDLPR
ncbi:MAG: hybrid sensor histidine kinase/response regulator [Bermanella sp.]